MKTYFINLFNYDRYANERILKSIIEAKEPDKPVQLMAHLLAAQLVWINRCLDIPPADVELWPSLGDKRFNFPAIIANNHLAWITYLNKLEETDFDKIISYKSLKGDNFNNQLSDIITQVLNHGTHHRAQIGQQLKFSGLENLPNTDYIFYLRQLKN
ncbi:MAG TPA: hypothetical protein VIM16_14430 [Mucilaginibacter sp.]|jgi:uncharacterized damage-inducible protein DinB